MTDLLVITHDPENRQQVHEQNVDRNEQIVRSDDVVRLSAQYDPAGLEENQGACNKDH